jgi:L-serine dehydratase
MMPKPQKRRWVDTARSAELAEASYPSIFNDVIGPIMRGPSSSHCAASVRIGRLARDLMDGVLSEVRVEFDASGSLATTHKSHGSDMGLFGGLLGWPATDERLPQSREALWEAGIRVEIKISDYGAAHPNTYKLTLTNPQETREMTALSTGGGMIEVVEIDGVEVSLRGDHYETLVYPVSGSEAVFAFLSQNVDADQILLRGGKGTGFVQVKAQRFLPESVVSDLRSRYGVRAVKRLSPVLPVLSRREIRVPFVTSEEMLEFNRTRELSLWELAVRYESARGNLSERDVLRMMAETVGVMQKSISEGIEGTEYSDRILGYQSGPFQAAMWEGRLICGGVLDRMILYVTAIMEAKSSMGVIVAAPTAGACGGLPGAVIGAANDLGLSSDDATRAMLAAGMIGVFIAAHSTFAAEIGGCQAECGAGSGMAAAALVTLAGGSTRQAVDAASLALQNILGMICDPVANRVEVPCLGRNVLAAANALACANMALAGYDAVIPLDEVIQTMDAVGRSIAPELRCTALGGLSVTRTSREIERQLKRSFGG